MESDWCVTPLTSPAPWTAHGEGEIKASPALPDQISAEDRAGMIDDTNCGFVIDTLVSGIA